MTLNYLYLDMTLRMTGHTVGWLRAVFNDMELTLF